MEINYDLKPEDLTYYSKEGARGTSINTIYVIIITSIAILFMISDLLIAMVAVAKNDGSIKLESYHMLPRLLIVFAIMGITYFTLMTVSKRSVRKAANSPGKNGLFCQHTLTISDEGLAETTHVNRNFYLWEGVDKITETANYVAIHIRLGSGCVIPKREFRSLVEKESFVGCVRNNIAAANSHTSPPPPPQFDR